MNYKQMNIETLSTGQEAVSNLLIAALGAAEVTLDIQTGCLCNHFTCSTCSAEIVSGQNTAVSDAELNQKFFFGVMCNQCYVHYYHSSLLLVMQLRQSRQYMSY